MAERSAIHPNAMHDAALVSEGDLAARWNKSVRTVQRMRARRQGPPWFNVGRSVFYRYGDILKFEMNVRQGGDL